MNKLNSRFVSITMDDLYIKDMIQSGQVCTGGLVQPVPYIQLNPNPPVINQSLTITVGGSYSAFAEHGDTVTSYTLQILLNDNEIFNQTTDNTTSNSVSFSYTPTQYGAYKILAWATSSFGYQSAKSLVSFTLNPPPLLI